MEPVRTGIIGCGPRTRNGHAPALQAAANAELVAVCDLIEDLAREVATQFGVRYYTDHREMLAAADVESVVIVTATKFHADLALDVVAAGKHVLCEKPLADDLDKARELVACAEAAGLRGGVGYQGRFRPELQALKAHAAEVEPVQMLINRPRGVMSLPYLLPDPLCGIMDYISHDLDLALWVMGREPLAVSACLRRGIYTDTQAIDLLTATIEFGPSEDKATATVVSTMGGAGLGVTYQVVGRRGYAALGLGGPRAARLEPDESGVLKPQSCPLEFESLRGNGATLLMHEHFARCIRDPDLPLEPCASLADGLRALEVALAIVEAGETGCRIPFPLRPGGPS